MATTSGTVTNVFNILTPLGPKKTSAGLAIFTAFLTINIAGIYDQAANSQCLAVTTAIQNSTRNGKTVALLAGGVSFASFGDEAGTPIGAKTCVVVGTGITFELTTGDGSTEHAAVLLGPLGNDICFAVTYTEA